MKRRVFAAVGMMALGAGAVGLAVYGPGLASSDKVGYLTATATKTTVTAQAVATGTVSAVESYGLAFGADPAVITSTSTSTSTSSTSSVTWVAKVVNATVGQKVTKGETLATADTSSANLQLVIAKANLADRITRFLSAK